jgi:hypothetical protein
MTIDKLFDKLRHRARRGGYSAFIATASHAWHAHWNEMNWLTHCYGSWESLYRAIR